MRAAIRGYCFARLIFREISIIRFLYLHNCKRKKNRKIQLLTKSLPTLKSIEMKNIDPLIIFAMDRSLDRDKFVFFREFDSFDLCK